MSGVELVVSGKHEKAYAAPVRVHSRLGTQDIDTPSGTGKSFLVSITVTLVSKALLSKAAAEAESPVPWMRRSHSYPIHAFPPFDPLYFIIFRFRRDILDCNSSPLSCSRPSCRRIRRVFDPAVNSLRLF